MGVPEETEESGPAAGGRAQVSGIGDRGGQPVVDLDFVRGLIEAVDGSGIDSLEITRAGTRIRISKTPPAPVGPPPLYAPHTPVPYPPSASPASPSAAAPQESAAGAGSIAVAASALFDVKSPMVGTFYRAPAPEAPPYVEVGSRVTKGQTLCILEAMKLMNELESEADGVVREVLVDNAEPVEFGQILFRIDPNG